MLRRFEETRKETRERVRDGKGVLEFAHYFSQEEMHDKSRLFARITINPGCSLGWHEHVNDEEIYYILSGKGMVNDNGTTYEVKAGDAILTRDKEFHSIENTGDVPIEMLAIVILY